MGYLLINIIPLSDLNDMVTQVKEADIATYPEYDIVLKKLHSYYDMKLVTFGLGNDSDLIIQLPVFVQPYSQSPVILYQTEIVPVPRIDQNT